MSLFFGLLKNCVTAINSVELVAGVTVIGIIFAAFLVTTVIRRFVG